MEENKNNAYKDITLREREEYSLQGKSSPQKSSDLYETLISLLKTNPNFIDRKGEILLDSILLKDNKQELINLLLSNEITKEHFFKSIENIVFFDEDEFLKYIRTKNYLENSYTSFENKIGFSNRKQLDNNIVLEFPYKDCVLEGGQTKEDKSKRKEIFFNEILAKDEIKRLFEPKVLARFERYNINNGKNDEVDPRIRENDNCFPVIPVETGIHSDYIEVNIDYKKKNKQKEYTFFNRDKDINKKRNLPEDTITDNLLIKGNNLIALHSLVKEFRGKVKLIYIDPPYNTGNDDFTYNDNFNHSTWLCFMKNRLEIARELLADDGSIFISIDENMKSYIDLLCKEIKFDYFKELIWESGKPFGFKATQTIWPRVHETIFHFCKNKGNIYYKPTYSLEKSTSGEFIMTSSILKAKENGIYSMDWVVGARESVGFGTGQKPEALIKKLMEATTNPHDLVLDFFAGSGTTGAVAHKMNRQWIMVEQMDYIDTITKERLKKVIEGEQGGISKSVDWKGGGEFVYMELKKYNENFIDRLKKVETKEEVIDIFNEICEKGFVKYNVDIKELKKDIEKGEEESEFLKYSLDEMKEKLYDILDKNMLYIPLSMLEDKKFKVSENEKRLNNEFYKKTKEN